MKTNKLEVVIFITVFLFMFLSILLPFLPWGEWSIIRSFENNKTEMTEIAQDILKSTESISIGAGSMELSGTEGVGEKEIARVKSFIKEQDYLFLNKHNQTVFFAKKERFRGCEGVAYTSDGRRPQSNLGNIGVIKKLDDNWYHCTLD